MSALPVSLEARPASLAPSARRPLLRVWAVLAPGLLLCAATLVLLALRPRPGVPDAGAPDAVRVLVRVAAGVCLIVPGALLFAHLPRHPVGWAMCAAGLGSLVATAAGEYALHSQFVAVLPGTDWAGWLYGWASAPITLIPGVALLLFPDGRLLGRRWRPALWCGLTATALIVIGGTLAPSEDFSWVDHPFLSESTAKAISDPFGLGWFLVLPASIAGIRAIAARRRTATGESRAQLALLQRMGTVVAVGFAACLFGALLFPAAFDAGALVAVTSLSLLGAGMAVAILRHRLLGLDVFVDRALVLSGMTIVLGALCVGAVLLVSALLGVDVELGAALPATALVAVAFGPVRERLQRGVNRLLHGQRDEPYDAMSRLGRRLGDAVEPARVLPVMAETIAETLRLPYVAVELDGAATTPAVEHGIPAAGVALRLGLVHAGEHVGTLVVGAREHGVPLSAADRRLLEDFARRASAAASAVALAGEVQH
ncbi:MAG: hypothetical protein M3P44_05295, partial [Actinomycetota bacterium]|nr:hypothetical protein [Actinomycetota bacterium]